MPNPKEKTILETFKDSPYKDYTLDCLATSTLSSIGYICKMLDEKYKIPEMKNGEMNPDSWVNKNLSIGSELNSQYRHMDPNASFKYVPDRRSMAMGSVYDSDVSDLDKKASQFYNDVTREYKQLCEEKKDDPEFKAFKNIFDAQMLSADYRSGDYFSALADNPYLMSFFSQSNGMPRFESLPLSELKKGLEASPSADPETKGPLGMLDEYCRCTNELIRREYDKQKLIKEGYTPEQEKEYLQNLKRDMTATVTNFNKLYKFCEEHGSKYKAGGFLNNDLDHITGVDNNHTRDVGHSVGHVQGQIRAIDNGWGMEELVPLGALGELKYRLETDYRKGDYSINNQSNMVKTALDNMEKAKAEKNDKKEKAAQADYEDHLLKRQQAIDKKQQSKDLLDDMKELDDTVLNRKVSNAAEKLEVINTILDFAEKKEKKYPETPVNALFGKELKTLISETREKVFGELQMDNAIKGLEDGQKGTLFGKKDYDKVLKDMKALNEMYKTNKNAFLNYDKTAYTPEIKAKEEEVLAGMKAYKLRKEKEFNNNRAEGKEDNANSIRRYNAMEKAMNDLSVRIDYNKRLAKGFAPAAQPLVNDEPQAQAPNVKAKDAAPGNRPVINKETVNYLRALKIAASNARGILQDSDEYLSFCAAIDNVTDVTVSILHSRKKGLITDENNDYERYKKAVQHLKMSALDYEDYKLSDHTEDPENEPKKKKLNSDDRTKLKIVRTVLKNNPYFNIGEPVPDIVERKLTQAQDKLRSEKEKLGGQFPDRFNLRDQYATVAAANNIRIARKQGEFKHITEDKFDKVVDTFKKMPAFRKAMNEGTDEELFEHAVNKNGQLLYEDISKANRTLKNLEESTQAVHRNVKTLNQSDKTLGS